MKKSPMAAAVLGTLCAAASAQSSVTIFGTLDVNGRYVKNDGSSRRLSLSQDGINSSQLGFRGVEDLGGGLKAGFLLLATILPDTGSTTGKFWNRDSYVSLSGKFGELRLGREWVPTLWNNAIFDAMGPGIAVAFNVWQLQTTYFPAGATNGNTFRTDNSIGYFLPPNLGGVYGQAMVAAGEGGTNQGRLISARLGFASGSYNVAVAAGQQRFDLASNPAATGITAGSHQTTVNLGASYDFGPVKLLGFIDRDTRASLKETRGAVSTVVPLGLHEVRVGYARSKLTNDLAQNSNTVSQFAATYQYNFSKRTAIYATGSQLKNGSHPFASNPLSPGVPVTQSVAGWNSAQAGTGQTAQPSVGGKSTGFELGIRHFF